MQNNYVYMVSVQYVCACAWSESFGKCSVHIRTHVFGPTQVFSVRFYAVP